MNINRHLEKQGANMDAKIWKKNKSPYDMIKGLKDPDEIFDLICVANYFAGNFNQNVPVEESRKAFEHIKRLIKKGGGK